VPHDAGAAIRQLQVLPSGDEGIGFGNQHLGQHSAFEAPGLRPNVDKYLTHEVLGAAGVEERQAMKR
jgi:hypothetical protein